MLDPLEVERAKSSFDELLRKYNPLQPRDWRGRWALTAAIKAVLKAQGGKPGGARFPDGRFFDWSEHRYNRGHDTYTFKAGDGSITPDDEDYDGEGFVSFDLDDNDMDRLLTALTQTRIRDSVPATGNGDDQSVALATLATVTSPDAVSLGEDFKYYFDWSERRPNGNYVMGVSNEDEDQSVEFEITPDELAQLIASLTLSTQAPETQRSKSVQRANEGGGSGSSRQYSRVQSGEHGGEFAPTNTGGSSSPTRGPVYSPRGKSGGGGSSKPSLPASSKFKTLGPGEDNDPAAVAEMQQLLTALGLGNLGSGKYDMDTENAVKEAQKRLGIKPNGKANKALVNKLLNAYDLSPCVKRADDPDPSDLIRSEPECEFTVSRSEDLMFDTLRAAVAEPAEDQDEEPVARAYTRPREPEPVDEPEPAQHREIMRYERFWDLDDIEIMRGGDGRTVEAYAAVFDVPTEIKDAHGHYYEVINRSAFNRTISHGLGKVGFFYHHGMTLHGTPSDLGSVPIGSPLEIKADQKGLRTISRFNKSALADSVLEAIRAGDLRGYSFRGRIVQSTPNRVPRNRAGDLPTIVRNELGLTEYGPTPTPYYADAGILAVRSAQLLAGLDAESRERVFNMFSASTPTRDPEPDNTNATPSQGPGAEDSPAWALRSAEELLALQATAAAILTRSSKK